jgi:putative restriction endonuclease
LKDIKFKSIRLSDEPHYFGFGVIGDIVEDSRSDKGDLFCEIKNLKNLYWQK